MKCYKDLIFRELENSLGWKFFDEGREIDGFK